MSHNKFKKLIGTEEERAVSPVIGVILMVAITVILAAVIAAFVLDIGPGDPNPQAAVSVGDDPEEFDVELQSLDNANGVVVVDGSGEDADIVDSEDGESVLTTSGQVESFDSSGDNFDEDEVTVQAVRFDSEPSADNSVGDETTANAIIENFD